MPLLFDVSPEEPTRKGSARSRRPAAEETPKADEFVPPVMTAERPLLPIGRIDHTYACPDARCLAECHDIVAEDDGDWLIQCCFCGTGQWVRAIKGHLKPREQEFRFTAGTRQGMTIDEAAATPNGMDFVEWAATEHKSEAVKNACQTWLDTRRNQQ